MSLPVFDLPLDKIDLQQTAHGQPKSKPDAPQKSGDAVARAIKRMNQLEGGVK